MLQGLICPNRKSNSILASLWYFAQNVVICLSWSMTKIVMIWQLIEIKIKMNFRQILSHCHDIETLSALLAFWWSLMDFKPICCVTLVPVILLANIWCMFAASLSYQTFVYPCCFYCNSLGVLFDMPEYNTMLHGPQQRQWKIIDQIYWVDRDSSVYLYKTCLGPLLLTWFNFNPSMDK